MKNALALLAACLLTQAGLGFAGEPITLKFNLVKPNTDPQYAWYGRFFSDVEKETNGYVKTQLYSGESLGTAADIIEQASLGEAVVADCDVGYLANYVPDMAAVQAPYMIEAPEEILVMWDSDLFQNMCRQLEDKGLHLIALNYEGTRSMLTKVPITSRAEVAKLKLRCAAAPLWNAVVKVLNGNPTTVPMSETYQALSQGVVDGAEGVFSVFYSQKWHESAKYLTMTEHMSSNTAIVMSSEIYRALPADVRTALDKVAYRYMEEFLALSEDVQQGFLDKLKAEGVIVSEIDKTEFVDAAKDVPSFFPDWSPALYDKLKAVVAASKKK